MTSAPDSINAEDSLLKAHALMRERGIRHLPVLRDGALVGMITERDLALVESLLDVDATTMKVAAAMRMNVYVVSPEAPLDEVVRQMAERKLGSAIIAQRGSVVGIFTTVDVCRALAELLTTRLGS